MATLRFRSAEAYRKWLAYKNIHLGKSKRKDKIIIAGRAHKVKH